MHVQHSSGMMMGPIDQQSSSYDKALGMGSAMSSQINMIDSGDRRDRPLENATFGIFDEGANVEAESTEIM